MLTIEFLAIHNYENWLYIVHFLWSKMNGMTFKMKQKRHSIKFKTTAIKIFLPSFFIQSHSLVWCINHLCTDSVLKYEQKVYYKINIYISGNTVNPLYSQNKSSKWPKNCNKELDWTH